MKKERKIFKCEQIHFQKESNVTSEKEKVSRWFRSMSGTAKKRMREMEAMYEMIPQIMAIQRHKKTESVKG